MTSSSDTQEWIADRMLWQFRRGGAAGAIVRPVGDFPPTIRGELQRLAGDDETPVLGCYRNANDCVLLTTARLVWLKGGTRSEVANSSIVDVSLDFAAAKGSVRGLDTIRFVANGAQHLVQLEPGAPVRGVFNVLHTLAGENRAKQGA